MRQGELIVKDRYTFDGWEVDVFSGSNQGLITAEFELHGDVKLPDPLPDWIGEEVTFNPAYKNLQLALNPYSNWK